MPLERKQCDCGHHTDVCPECGSNRVTHRDDPMTPSPNRAVDYGSGDGGIEYTHVCWDCSWSETVRVTIERDV